MRYSTIVRDLLLIIIGMACAAAAPTTPGPDTTGSTSAHANVIAKSSGDAQQGTMSSLLGAPLVVTVTNSAGRP